MPAAIPSRQRTQLPRLQIGAVDPPDPGIEVLVEREVRLVLRQPRGELLVDPLDALGVVGGGQREEDRLDPVQGQTPALEGLDGVGEGGRVRVGQDRPHALEVLGHRRLEGRQEVLLLDPPEVGQLVGELAGAQEWVVQGPASVRGGRTGATKTSLPVQRVWTRVPPPMTTSTTPDGSARLVIVPRATDVLGVAAEMPASGKGVPYS